MEKNIHPVIGMGGNPNSGKSSLFNRLTGLKQKTGNYAGVTVEMKRGNMLLPNGTTLEILDLPGSYSIHPTTMDEEVFTSVILDPANPNYPDVMIYVMNSLHIDRHLLMATQLLDLGIPTIFALSLSDLVSLPEEKIDLIRSTFNVPVVPLSSKTGAGIDALKTEISKTLSKKAIEREAPLQVFDAAQWQQKMSAESLNGTVLPVHDYPQFIQTIQQAIHKNDSSKAAGLRLQVWDTMTRFEKLSPLINALSKDTVGESNKFTSKLDRILVHPVLGLIIFCILLLLIFQSIFSWSEKPIEWLETAFSFTAVALQDMLPASWMTNMLVRGVIPGLSGIIVFVPQIMFLFIWITILEESGYMSRVVYMGDFWMRRFGLNGRSTIALLSGTACAIPAIMSTRTISNWKERLITIMVTPLISCAARLPVYSLLIVFVVPAGKWLGLLNYKGLAFFGIYVFSTAAAIFAAWVFKKIIKSDEKPQLLLELPDYRMPIFKNVMYNVWNKVRSFIVEAGKIIFMISIVLWALTSYGPQERLNTALLELEQARVENTPESVYLTEANVRLENSWAGIMGQWIEPVLKPLGFDWKIGIALITSFAAREVFVGTMATIYNAHEDEEPERLSVMLANQINPKTGEKVFNLATSASLIVFYIFALQCLSTVAVVKKETGSWRWPIIQLVLFTAIAYLGSLLTFNLLS